MERWYQRGGENPEDQTEGDEHERNLGYCRWGDDFVIVVRSERAAQRVMKGTIAYLEEELGLLVNRGKSRVAPIKEVTFLGFQILRGKIRVSTKAQARFKARVRELTRRNNPLSMYQVIRELNKYLRGWVGYFGIQEFKYLFRDLDAWIRSRLRSTQLKKWKKPKKFQRIMFMAGFDPNEAHRTWIKMNRWQSVMRRPVRFVMNLDWFRTRGLVFLHDFTIAESPPKTHFAAGRARRRDRDSRRATYRAYGSEFRNFSMGTRNSQGDCGVT